MASISSWLWGTSQLDEAVDKATSELIPNGSEDVALNLEICDQIRSKSVSAKDAMRALKRRLNHKNPNVQLLALSLTDICVKNGGDHFLTELASREFMDNLVSILKIPALNQSVKNDILKYIQNWSLAFEGKPSLNYVGQVYKSLNSEGYHFPPKDFALANSAMVDTSTAPEWIDSDVCLRCRTPFTFTNRKHHCRNCGQVFDQQCSSKSIPLPHFGITQAVRVCDGCYSKLQKKAEKSDKGHRQSASMYSPRHSSPRDLADAELQRAIELSLEEVGPTHARRPGYVPVQPSVQNWQTSEPPVVHRKTHPDHKVADADEDDPELRAAIEASLREVNTPKPSAPVEVASTDSYNVYAPTQSDPPTVMPAPSAPKLTSYDLEPMEADAILTFSQTVEQVQTQGGRDMSRYPAVNELFDKASGLRPKLAMSLDDTDRKEQLLSEMHDKLSQAVKLYDKLLTEQVSRPTWRRSPQQAHSPAVPMRQSTQTPANGYTQWAPSHQSASSISSPVFAPPRTDSAQYAPQPPLSAVSELEPQPQYVHYSQPYASEVPGPSQHPTAPLQPQQIPQFASPPTSVSYLPPQTPASPPIPAHQPVSIPQFATAPLAPSQPPPAPQPVAQPPTPQSPTLARHRTVSARAAMSSPPAAQLARASTLSHALRPQYQQPTQPQLPQFPTAPTTAPQLYAPSPPTTIPERREEMLIEL
ncbi:ubiquitin binding protein [Rhizopogon vinicolor AM-OR11-026]|uniref:Vacuolar protein sorting-associated protein 27 n=1 Tax=Rhizopogon vinicolor AM-OR11-026 TaxID=1314800 RepID=A0A1B7N6J8_9AGAM|nr:ubiquitin binding protein [Rhizopogon vinicolor AM-OR11-026]